MILKDEYEEVTKEIEELNLDIEHKLKLEITINKNLEDAENFKKEKNQWKLLEDKTYYFKQNIERIWDSIKTLDFLFIINNSENYPFIIKKGSNVWNIGNIFEGKLFDIYETNSKVIKQKLNLEFKKTEWIFFLGNGEIFTLKLNLYKITEDNSTVLNMIIKYIPSYGENIINKIKEKINDINFSKYIEEMLKNDPVYLYQYESGIIQGNMGEIWDILIDYSKLALIAPNNRCFAPVNINNLKIGEITKIPLKIKNIEGNLEIKLDLKEKKVGYNDWAFGYSILGGGPFKTTKQTFFVKLTRINKQEAQICIFTKIYEKIPLEVCKYLSQQKKYVISSIKDYFENFSVYNNNDY